MKIRSEWMSDEVLFGGNYPNNTIIQDAKRRFEIQRDESLDGRDAEIDGIPRRIVVQAHTNVLYQTKYDYKIHCDTYVEINTGSIVNFNDKDWMVVTKIYSNKAYKTASILQCNNNINIGDNIIPVCIESQTRLFALGISKKDYFSTPESEIVMMVSDNEMTKTMRRNDVFKLTSIDNYKVVDLNKVIMPGIIIAKLEWCSQDQLPDSPPSPISSPKDGISITGSDEIKFGQTVIYTAQKYDNKIEIPAVFTFTVTGENAYTLKILSDNQCSIQCNDYPHTIVLRATVPNNNFVEKQIKLKPLL